jgi:hypothetical protein
VHPHFSDESENMHLGLCSDRFNLFRSFAASYSCWPVILMVYNLPPGMCMRPELIFLFTVIPGPNCNDPAFSRPKSMELFSILLAMTFCELVIMFHPYHGIIGI